MSFSIRLSAEERSMAESYARLHSLSLADAFKRALFEKIEVNGASESPLYTFLKAQAPFKGYPEGSEDFAAQLNQIHQQTGSGFDQGDAIRWNFGKFIVSKDGKTILRFEPMVAPSALEEDIQRMLASDI